MNETCPVCDIGLLRIEKEVNGNGMLTQYRICDHCDSETTNFEDSNFNSQQHLIGEYE